MIPDAIAGHFKAELLRQGKVTPTVAIKDQGKYTYFAVPQVFVPSREDYRTSDMFNSGLGCYQKCGASVSKTPEAFYFAQEAWITFLSPGEDASTVVPSEAPDRKELLVITGVRLFKLDQLDSVMYEMVRASGTLDLVTLNVPGASLSSNLLPSFVAGFMYHTLPPPAFFLLLQQLFGID